jgi:hypothetical protein
MDTIIALGVFMPMTLRGILRDTHNRESPCAYAAQGFFLFWRIVHDK